MAGGRKRGTRKPRLDPAMRADDFKSYYWMKQDLVAFARQLGLPTHGYKPELSTRILEFLTGAAQPEGRKKEKVAAKVPRDSNARLRRDTPVVNYKSDKKTREFFKSQIGPEFHFTYHVNQYRLAHDGLTYGDLTDEWIAERDRRKTESYQPNIADHGEYNQFIRDYFADAANRGKTMRDAATAWTAVKPTRSRRYQR